MKLVNILRVSTAALLATIASLSSASADEPTVKWKMAGTFSSSLPQLGTLGKRIEEQIAKVSGGSLEIRFYEPNALVPPLEAFDAVSVGAIDAAFSTPGFWGGKVPALQVFGALPFGPPSPEYMAWFYFGGGKEIFDEIYARHGIHSVMCGMLAPEGSGWFRKEISSVDDLAGLKLRFFGLGAKALEKFGVSAQLLAAPDVYPALDRGVIDGLEFVQPAIDLKMGFWQIAKHYYFPGWHQQSTFFDLMINKEKWDALTETQQAQIEAVCGDNVRYGIAEGEAIQVPALKELQEKGVELHRWSDEDLEKLHGAVDEVFAEQSAADPDFARAYASFSEFRSEYATWRELGYLK
ncbi:TRAP-type mannitol/chloroaromatic compound transport system substrate-binding protein [Hoeflea marina]|uniref:TRAP-type mannitol/chloroaromatic compound transport system substrate-binding protein n=1 Tax=Hoeflea marina TaxID=274592 RepID=A0A317PLT5_9HYPH|nr:TRAP transporter substrate-binding protein [Hoeflea marina]PWW01473.1 TRAP-type mannitol/chloroaromatic compound transport system substrate-binding protein [Hoeflea marina]